MFRVLPLAHFVKNKYARSSAKWSAPAPLTSIFHIRLHPHFRQGARVKCFTPHKLNKEWIIILKADMTPNGVN